MDLANKNNLTMRPFGTTLPTGKDSPVFTCILDDGRLAVTGTNDEASWVAIHSLQRFWENWARKEVGLDPCKGSIIAVCACGDYIYAAIQGDDARKLKPCICRWQISTGDALCIKTAGQITSLQKFNDHELVAIMGDGNMQFVNCQTLVRDPFNILGEADDVRYVVSLLLVLPEAVVVYTTDHRLYVIPYRMNENGFDWEEPTLLDADAGQIVGLQAVPGEIPRIAAMATDGTVRIWNIDSLQCENCITCLPGSRMCALQDGRLAIISGKDLSIWSDGDHAEQEANIEKCKDKAACCGCCVIQ